MPTEVQTASATVEYDKRFVLAANRSRLRIQLTQAVTPLAAIWPLWDKAKYYVKRGPGVDWSYVTDKRS